MVVATERRPAAAYYEVARWLGDAWFEKPTPKAGKLVVILGRDGVETRWHVDNLTASRMAEWAHGEPGLACLKVVPYDRRTVTP